MPRSIRLIDKVRRVGRAAGEGRQREDLRRGRSTIPGVEGLAVSASQLHRQIGAAITSTSAPRTFVAHTRHTQPKVTTAELEAQVRHGHHRQPRPVPPAAVQGRSSPRRPSGSPSGRSAWRRRPGQYTIANKAINPAWHVPNSAVGRQAGRQGHRRRRPQQPDQGALAGDLRRRRHPRRPPTTPRSAQRLPRLHPDAHPGRREALRRGAGGRRRLHRLERRATSRSRRRDRRRISSIATSSHPRSRSRAWWEECRSTSVPMKTPRSRLRRTANHSVEASRRALDAVPRARRQPVGADRARVDELAMGGDLTVAGVDEEHPHGRGG